MLILAILIAAIGEMTRTYTAFGGEDLLALILIGLGAYTMLKGDEKCWTHKKR